MNGFNFSEASDIKLGGSTITALYYGSTKLWPLAIDYSREYLTIESLADNNRILWKLNGDMAAKTIEWSTDKTTWHSVSSSESGTTLKTLNKNEKIYIKGSNNSYSSNEWGYNSYFESYYEFNIYGNIMSLIYGDNFIGQTTLPSATFIFGFIFKYSSVVEAYNLILPATTLAESCYACMFEGCTSLQTAPELPATTLADYCYYSMFYGCTSLRTAPELPATTLANYCYSNMFDGCGSFIGMALPATTLAEGCYNYMFNGCTSLQTAPELPATTLVSNCYNYMFGNCTRLSYIKMLATDISATNCLNNWVNGVASTGTFVKDYNLKSIPINSASGIPTGWTIEEVNKPDYSREYLTIESLADNNRILWKLNGDMAAKTIEWSTDKTNWTSVTASTSTLITTLNTGDKVYIKGSNANYGEMWNKYNYFSSDEEFNVYGNTMSLLYGDNFIDKTTFPYGSAEFYFLFYGSKVVDASNLVLPATSLSGYSVCYSHMFENCTYLTAAPALPATTLGYQCYNTMFSGCTSLTTAPVLPATNISQYSYGSMFKGCTLLNYVEVYAEDLGTWDAGFDNWLLNVSATGTFKKSANMTLFQEGASGIPSGWTVVNV